ncbi:MAG: hypothetical protein EOO51_06440 [Flavobacterium sp.]|nr:MAG: hypothetical protein EOO51_06440 [Flavobacterium sp.]
MNIELFPDEQECLQHLELIRWNGLVVSPFEPLSKVYRCSGSKYKCRDTGKYFNARTGTVFQNSRIQLRIWFMAIWLLSTKSFTSAALGKELKISQKTAWLLIKKLKRLRAVDFVNPNLSAIEVVVEPEKLNLVEWLNMINPQ